ncbi:hypothetical protein MMC26_001793 [Xylographa opegraphella]|nr:hypothetical protein [Xylographa opegraphella]
MESQDALDASPFCNPPTSDGEAPDKACEQQRLTFATEFVHRLQRDGYVRLRGHGISATQISEVFQAHKTFFDLPLSRKRELLHPGGARPARGFTPSHTEKTFLHLPHLSRAAPDAAEPREQFTLGPPTDDTYPTPWFPAPHLSPEHATLLTFYDACRTTALALTQALELGLGVRSGTLTTHCAPDASELTLNWYPAAAHAALQGPRLQRIWPHSDLGIVSLLFQDGVGGLEFEDRARGGGGGGGGGFVPVRPSAVPGELLLNAADTLERWTNGMVPAGVHRVAVPVAMRGGGGGGAAEGEMVPGRRSVVLLYRARGEASVAPLPAFVTPDAPARFGEMTATEYLKVKNKLTFGDVVE